MSGDAQYLMHKSTVFFSLISLGLALATGFVLLKLREPQELPNVATSESTLVQRIFGGSVSSRLEEDEESEISLLLLDMKEEKIIEQQNPFEQRPIASITKLMTAMVALDYGMPWEQEVSIQPNEYVVGGKLQMYPGERATVRDLFHASLIGSANNATLAYVRELGIPKDEFVNQMNRKAIELGLEQTHFEDVTGLNTENVSTAYEVALLASAAFEQYPDISAAASRRDYPITFRGSGRTHTITNTNRLVIEEGDHVAGGKTGFLYEAMYCLVVKGSGEYADRIAVVLGSVSEDEQFALVKKLLHESVS